MRAALAATLLLSITLPAASAAGTGGDTADKGRFLEKTYVQAPKAAGPYTLVRTDYDAARFDYGVTTEWRAADAPASLKLDVFVYPQGRTTEAAVVPAAAVELKHSIEAAAAQGLYSNVAFGASEPFVVVKAPRSILDKDGAPAAPFDPAPKSETNSAPTGGEIADPMAKVLAEIQESPNTHGIRQAIRFDRDGKTWRSAAFLFYRHLFMFKVRASVPANDMTQEAFDASADAAARELVPRIDVENFGSCGTVEIPAPAKGKDKEADGQQQAVGEALIRGIGRVRLENCANSPGKDDKVPAGYERMVIDYPAGIWKSSN